MKARLVLKRGWKLGALAVISIPLTIKAVASLTGDFAEITQWGIFGNGWSASSGGVNVVIGNYNTWADGVQNSLTIGSNLENKSTNSLTVGTWNLGVNGAELFVVSNGTSSMDKKNVLEVDLHEKVRAPQNQGDIPTGAFGE